jgi:LysR family transcriptional regulator, glycine cleavage system transcriptional activator
MKPRRSKQVAASPDAGGGCAAEAPRQPAGERALPPLALLRAFDAAARSGSFRAAAELLSVTPSAISHQVRALEAQLGVQLFERGPRRLALSAAGAQFFDDLAQGFDLLRRACSRLRERVAGSQQLRLSANAFLTSEWLGGLIPAFSTAFPQVQLSISVTGSFEDPLRGEVDLALRHGDGQWPGVEVVPLAAMRALPMRAPGLSPARLPRIDFPYAGSSAWSLWQARGRALPGRDSGTLQFSSFDAAMRAAASGLGITLGLLPLAAPWLRAGRLVADSGLAALPAGTLFLLHRPLSAHQLTLRRMRDWLAAALGSALREADEAHSPSGEHAPFVSPAERG